MAASLAGGLERGFRMSVKGYAQLKALEEDQ